MDIKQLFLGANDEGSNDYKSGWCDAICFLNDNYIIQERNGESIQISFDIDFDEETIKKVLEDAQRRK